MQGLVYVHRNTKLRKGGLVASGHPALFHGCATGSLKVFVCSICLAWVWAESIVMCCLFGKLKPSGGLWHPLGQVGGPPCLEQWGEGQCAGLGQQGPVEAMCQGLGCCCYHCDVPLLLAAVWSQKEVLSVEKQATTSLSFFSLQLGYNLVGFGLVEQSGVRWRWRRVQLPAGRWCWLNQHFSAQPLQCQMWWWFKTPVAKVSLTLHWNKVEERTCTVGWETYPDQNRGRYIVSLGKAQGTSLGGIWLCLC